MTYRLAAAHTQLQEPLFPRHSSASWWSHRGGIWPGWCHSLLWYSHPHPADHFCRTENVTSVDPSFPQASLTILPSSPSWISTQAQDADAARVLAPRMWLVPKSRWAAEGGWEGLSGSLFSRWLHTSEVLYRVCCCLQFLPNPLPLLLLRSTIKQNKEKVIFSCSAHKEVVLLGQIIQILDTLEFSLSSHSLSFLLPAFWTFHHFWYLHWECVQGQPEGELILLFIAYSGTHKKKYRWRRKCNESTGFQWPSPLFTIVIEPWLLWGF